MKFSPFSKSKSVSAIALSIGLMLPAQAVAQAAPEDEAPAVAEDETSVQSVVYVTARKRDETPLEIPLSVSAFSQDGLDERGILSNADLSAFVPGFVFENNGVGGFAGRANPQFRFRGVGAQVNTAASRSGAFFWDGAYISGGVGILPLVDLGQVEVIKGPQAAFFGRNTFSGAVNYIPAAPTDEFEGRLIGGISAATGPADDNLGYNLVGVVSGPITDKLSGRLAISQEKKGAYWDYGDGTPLGEEETLGFIGSLHYDINDDTSIKYSGFLVEAEDTSAYGGFASDNTSCPIVYDGQLVNVATGELGATFQTTLTDVTIPFPPFTPYSTFCGSIPDFDDDTLRRPLTGDPLPTTDPRNGTVNGFTGIFGNQLQMVQTLAPQFGSDFISAPDGLGNTYETYRHHLSFETAFDDGHTFAAFASYGEFENWAIFDNTYGASGDAAISYTGFAQEQKDTSLEVRLVSPSEQSFRYMIGASYYKLESTLVEIRNGNYAGTTSADPFFTSTDSDVFGLFAALDYDITDEVTLSLEGRYQGDEQTIPLADAAGGVSANRVENQSQSYSEFMPRVILSYQPTGMDLNLYGSFSQSYLQGTQTNADGFAAAEPTSGISSDTVGFFTPIQKLEAFEVGVKHDLNDMFQYSVALYQMDWENQVQFVLNPQFVPYYQAGDSEYTGIELEGTLNATDWITLTGTYNYTEAELTRYSEGGTLAFRLLGAGVVDSQNAISAAGNTPRYISPHTGSFSVDFDLESFTGRESFARIDALYTGDFFIDNLEFNQVDASTKINLRAGMAVNDMVMAEIYGTNVTDDLSASTSGGTTGFFSRSYFGTPVRGAEWGIRLTADF
ncbi:MAG: hypothetical protein Hens3KO_08290 [Henriciella sp.]